MGSIYSSYDYYDRKKKLVEWVLSVSFMMFYPMLVSMYPLLPPLIGLIGVIIIFNLEKDVVRTLVAMLYLINLDLNLGLPFMLSIFSILIINTFVYPNAKLIIRCKSCLLIFLLFLIDIFYYSNLFVYDFIFGGETIIANSMLWF
ncbi:MAG: hypothetical protein GXO06_02575, partial [Epsilonproteobacteria bacterium]|nr:hypothetical protein [Campylobacterota bacterium]